MSAPRRLYIGRLPQEVSSEEVSKVFEPFGRVVDCRVMTGFGFIEFEDGRDAQDALDKTDGTQFQGQTLLVEFAKENSGRRRERAPFEDRDRGFRARRPPGIRVICARLGPSASPRLLDLSDFSTYLVASTAFGFVWDFEAFRIHPWHPAAAFLSSSLDKGPNKSTISLLQDLKDFGREIANVSFADIDRDAIGEGVLEYLTREDADRACRELTGKTIRGRDVKVVLDDGTQFYSLSCVDHLVEVERAIAADPREMRDDFRRRSRSPRRRDDDFRRSPPRRYDDRRDYRDERDHRDDRYRRDEPRGDYRREDDRYNRRDDDRYRR
ncbi:RNA-binding domain-containing protein [Flagelloscypha sp. PMI_526]|nr:RNA-binding domain-containing protein [Flagelloscypha sp. PMI_526]